MNFLRKLFGGYSKYYKFKRKMLPSYLCPPKIMDWQYREKQVSTPVHERRILKPLHVIREIHHKAIKDFEYTSDKGTDYWATSKEIMESGLRDDCDGFAVYMWYQLRERGFSSNRIGMCIIEGHMFCVYHPINRIYDFWVIDNGFVSHKVVRASRVFPADINFTSLVPLYGFNLNKWWGYKMRGGK